MSAQLVESILERRGPCRSSEVVRELLSSTQIDQSTARKRVSRAGGRVRRLRPIRLPNKEAFLYLDTQFNSGNFWNRLIHALDETNSVFGYAMHSLIARQSVPEALFHTCSGSPDGLKGHLSSTHVLQALSSIEFCSRTNGNVVLMPALGNGAINTEAQFRAEGFLIESLVNWTRKVGLGSYNKVESRQPHQWAPHFGHFAWDLTAPCYISPLASRQLPGRPNPGFIVADVCLSQDLTERQIGYFINKCEILRNLRNTRPFLAILLADSFTEAALAAGRKRGLIFATPDDFFGSGVRTAFRSLITTLARASEVASSNPDVLARLLNSLPRIEGSAGNLKGALFELIVGHCMKCTEGGEIEIGRRLAESADFPGTDIDVLQWKSGGAVVAIECKGYGPHVLVTEPEVAKWVTCQIPHVNKWIKTQDMFRNLPVIHEFWTSGGFEKAASDRLAKAASATTKYTLKWSDGDSVKQQVRRISSSRLKDVYSEQFTRHPYARIAIDSSSE